MKKADKKPRKRRTPRVGDVHLRMGTGTNQPLTLQDVMPDTDPSYPIVSGILGVVPTSRWTFARVEPGGALVSLFGSHSYGHGLPALADEFKRQRTKSATGSRIAATLGSLEGFTTGITLLFADAHANFGILTLLRTAELGPFTSSEIRMLTFALDAVSDRLSALRLQPPSQPPRPHEATYAVGEGDTPDADTSAFYILDDDLHIVLAYDSEDQRRVALTGLHTRIAERLPILLEQTVRELTAAWSTQNVKEPGLARPVSFLVVRTEPMSGPAGLFIGVRIDRSVPANSLTDVASRYHITPREVQVLALLLDGNRLDQIGERLHITSSTVQDHIKSMLDKTGSRNRSELIARVLGWEGKPSDLPS